MSDSAKYKNSTRLIQLALMSGTLIASSAWGFETNYDRGRVDFAGRVTDISCSVALNGGNNAGSGASGWRRSAWRKYTIAGRGHL
jgi:type 1 fimbria pilin